MIWKDPNQNEKKRLLHTSVHRRITLYPTAPKGGKSETRSGTFQLKRKPKTGATGVRRHNAGMVVFFPLEFVLDSRSFHPHVMEFFSAPGQGPKCNAFQAKSQKPKKKKNGGAGWVWGCGF